MRIRTFFGACAVLAGAHLGCGDGCEGKSTGSILVAAGAACPSVAAAQAEFDSGNSIPPNNKTVERLQDVKHHPAATLCWYRVVDDGTCDYPTREEREAELPADLVDGNFACDDQGKLYAETLPEGAAECPAKIHPLRCCFDITTLVGADEYTARDECVYETSYDTTCGGGMSGPLS